jgi:hypothetical protein
MFAAKLDGPGHFQESHGAFVAVGQEALQLALVHHRVERRVPRGREVSYLETRPEPVRCAHAELIVQILLSSEVGNVPLKMVSGQQLPRRHLVMKLVGSKSRTAGFESETWRRIGNLQLGAIRTSCRRSTITGRHCWRMTVLASRSASRHWTSLSDSPSLAREASAGWR